MSSKSIIELNLIEGTKFICCPCCGANLLEVTTTNIAVVKGETWLQDGDCIPGLYEELKNEKRLQFNNDYELLVGTCRYCDGRYYVVELKIANQNIGTSEDDFQKIINWFEDNFMNGKSNNFIVTYKGEQSHIPKEWFAEQINSDKGNAYIHTFGPFKLESPQSVINRDGIKAHEGDDKDTSTPWHFAKHTLLTLWDDLYNVTGV